MQSTRGLTLTLAVLALGAVAAVAWLLLRPEPPVSPPPPPGGPQAIEDGAPSPAPPPPRAAKETRTGPDGGVDDERDLPDGPDAVEADFETIRRAVLAEKWLEVQALLSSGGGSSDPRVTELLAKALSDPRWRNTAAELAQYMKDPAAASRFLEVARTSKDDFTRAAALAACGHFGGAEVFQLAADLFRSAPVGSVLGSAEGLGRIGTREAADLLIEGLRKAAGGPVSAATVQALGMMRSPEAIDEMARLLNEEGEASSFRTALAAALGHTKDPRAVSGLLTLVRGTKDADLRAAGYGALGMVGDSQAVQELLSVATGADNQDKFAAAQALQSLSPASKEAAGLVAAEAARASLDPVIRQYFISSLGKMKAAETLPTLVALARQSDEASSVRATAVRALGEFGDRSAAPAILEVLEGAPASERDLRRQAIVALGMLGDAALLPKVQRMFEAAPKETSEWFLLRNLVDNLRSGGPQKDGVLSTAPLSPLGK